MDRFVRVLFAIDAVIFSTCSCLLLFTTNDISCWIVQNTTVSHHEQKDDPLFSTVHTLSTFLAVQLGTPVLPFLYISASSASLHIPALLFSSLLYAVIAALLLIHQTNVVPTVWTSTIWTVATMSTLHFLSFANLLFAKVRELDQTRRKSPSTSTLTTPLLPSSAASLEPEQEQKKSRIGSAAASIADSIADSIAAAESATDSSTISIALEDLASANAVEDEKREGRGYGTLQLLKIARPHRHWLYYACAVLLVRLPLSLSVPHWVAETIGALINSDYQGAQRNVLYLCVAGTGDALLDFWCVYLFGIAQQRIIRGLRLNLFQAILHQEISFFDTTKTGEITSRLTADCAEMANDLTSVFRFTIESLVRIGGIIAYMFVRSWRLGLLALAIIPVTAIINRLYANFMHRNQMKVQAALAEGNSVAQEAISAIRTVCSFAMEEGEYLRYEARVDKYYRLIIKQYYIQGIYYMVCNTFLIQTVVQASILTYGGYLIKHDLLEATVLISYMLYQSQLQEYFQNLFNSFTSLIKSSGAAAKVFDYIDRKPRYRRPRVFSPSSAPFSAPFSAPSPTTTQQRFSGHVSLRDVHFCYPSRPEALVLRGFSLDVKPGSCVALVGASGSGKSTVFSLIEHFYEVQRGFVHIDGMDVRDMKHAALHHVVAMVGQEPELMSGTIESNILYGVKRQEDLQEDLQENLQENLQARMISAAKDANAHDFILNELPNGYSTDVGERGVQLSGGQKQRIAIARCLMQNPRVLLLDEATSALDSESEALVQEALNRAMVGRTTIMIAHRLSTVKHADVIVVLQSGQVVEFGSHDTLMLPSSKGFYKKLVERQTLLSLSHE